MVAGKGSGRVLEEFWKSPERVLPGILKSPEEPWKGPVLEFSMCSEEASGVLVSAFVVLARTRRRLEIR